MVQISRLGRGLLQAAEATNSAKGKPVEFKTNAFAGQILSCGVNYWIDIQCMPYNFGIMVEPPR